MTARSDGKLRIVVLGYIVRGPLGGLAWHHLQYCMGLARLGHEVYFVEDSDDYASCYDPVRGVTDADPTYGLRFAAATFDRVGLGEKWAFFDAHTSNWRGPLAPRAQDICKAADLVLNISAINPLRPWTEVVPVRVLIDTDPAFTQVRHLSDPQACARAHSHNVFFTFGENFGQPDCLIPDDGLPWRPTRQPMVLDAWEATPGAPAAAFTTVMQWDSYPRRQYGGMSFGMKAESFGAFLELPRHTTQPLELALGSACAPRDLLRKSGWSLRDPLEVTRDAWRYQEYIRASKGEFGIAKHGYIVSNSGWFSERSAAYLASGRPVVVQQTGFRRWLGATAGVAAFSTLEEARAALEEVASRYPYHCRAAREVAREWFDSDLVLGKLLDYCFAAPR
ncbi:MAG: hypothetical protein OEZ08_08195 [Betaproteobacteria bacterium]|nr:hypothetical protein [Betaproteobacteria bacterium]